MHYLLDGYNIAFFLAEDSQQAPEALRRLLLDTLSQERPRDATRVSIYWDSRRQIAGGPGQRTGGKGCTQHYVPDADEAIIDAVWEAGREARRLVVVSGDREVTGKSRQLGAKTKRPGELFGR